MEVSLREWITKVSNWIVSHRPLDSNTIRTENTGTGIRWHMINPQEYFDTYQYEGPFAVIKYTDTSVRVYSYNATEGRTWESLAYIDLTKVTVAEEEIDITGPGFVWVEFSASGTTVSYDIKFDTDLPAQANNLCVRPLADIGFADGAITQIIQLQYGTVYGSLFGDCTST